MTEDEIAQLLTETEESLAELGLNFIVAQERVLAAEGVSQSPTGPAEAAFDDEYIADADDGPLYLNQVASTPGQRSGPRPRFKRGDVVVTPLRSA
ncbi:hypothetical protein [Micromonospora lupini]|uniref:hypothetical protein n=1 Tax=Micromonospora lupini TaxID=285679 RepID=UPI0031E17C4B